MCGLYYPFLVCWPVFLLSWKGIEFCFSDGKVCWILCSAFSASTEMICVYFLHSVHACATLTVKCGTILPAWDELCLVAECSPFNMRMDTVCWHFAEGFCMCPREGHWLPVFFLVAVSLFDFCLRVTLPSEWVRDVFFCSLFRKNSRRIGISFLSNLRNHQEALWFWVSFVGRSLITGSLL
jgi:hypothetical protein